MIFNFMKGYLKLVFDGKDQIRFINLCRNHELRVWDVRKNEKDITMYSGIEDFYKMKHLSKKCNGRPRITEKHGLPFLIHRYNKRMFFLAGIVVYFLLIELMSRYVWSISFEGNYSYSDYELMDFLREKQIECGKLISEYRCDDIEYLIRQRYNDITWVSAEKYGTRLIIHVQENYDKKISEMEEKPYDIVSDVDGTVKSVITRTGVCQVKEGDEVKKGQILVSGKIDYLNDAKEITATRLVNSDADIYAYVIVPYENRFSKEYEDKVFSGRKNQSLEVGILGMEMHLTGLYRKFQQFDTVNDYHTLRITKNFHLPIRITKSKYLEYEVKKNVYTDAEAKEVANHQIENFIDNLEEKGIQIIQNNVTIETNETECRASGYFVVVEKIGQVQYIEEEEETK